MKHLIKGMGAAYVTIALLWVGGCASTLQWTADTFDVEVVPAQVQQNAYKAASVSFTAWESVQGLVEKTGHLPRCTEAVKFLCVSQATWDKVKDIEARTSATLLSLKPAIEAGSNDVALLMSIPAIVHDAQAAIQKETAQ